MTTPQSIENQSKTRNKSQFKGFSFLSRSHKNGLKRSVSQRFNFTPVPNEMMDLLPDLSSSELKVLLYIVRRTLGFNKVMDTISHRQFLTGIKTKDGRQLDKGAGVSKNSLHRAIRSLENKGVISKSRRSNAKGKDLSCQYGLVFAEVGESTVDERSVPLSAPQFDAVGEYQKTHTNKKNFVLQKQRCYKKPSGRGKYHKDQDRVDYLVDEIEKVTGDTHSRGGFAQIAISLSDQIIFQILSEIKHTTGLRNKGAVFMSVARNYLAEGVSVPPEKTAKTVITPIIRADKHVLRLQSPEVVKRAELKPTTSNSLAGRSLKDMFCKTHPELAEKIGIKREVIEDDMPVYAQYMMSTSDERVQNTDLPDRFSRRLKAVNLGCGKGDENASLLILSTPRIQSDGLGRGQSQPRNPVFVRYTGFHWLRLSLPPPLSHQRTVAP